MDFNRKGAFDVLKERSGALGKVKYRHIRNYYRSNSKIFQDGNGNGNFEEINSNDFLDGTWESMEIKGRLQGPRR